MQRAAKRVRFKNWPVGMVTIRQVGVGPGAGVRVPKIGPRGLPGVAVGIAGAGAGAGTWEAGA